MTLNDTDVEADFCAIKIVETFKHHSYVVLKATVDKSGLVFSVWGEQCHQMDENKPGSQFWPEKVDFQH